MKKLKVYLDTSVIGGSFDDEFKKHSIRLIEAIKKDKIIGVISEVTVRELDKAPEFVKNEFDSYKSKLILLNATDEIADLADEYVREKIISKKFYDDAFHIAFATINNIDLLVSWNFKHIVNYNKIIQFNSVNLRNGYKEIMIYSPMEVLNEEE